MSNAATDSELLTANSSSGNVQAAIARTSARTLALYFSRPVRLFRPTKVSGWHLFRSIANREGTTLTPQFISTLVKTQGLILIPKHFIPPILLNAGLSTVLFTTYTETAALLDPHIGEHPTVTAAISGGVAGGLQAVVAAPAENLRIILEGANNHHSWSHAWKDVFKVTTSAAVPMSQEQKMDDIRRIRTWMKDVGEMAGRGWDGWGWGMAKDVCGFAVFFSIFDVTRRVALWAKSSATEALSEPSNLPTGFQSNAAVHRHLPRVVHGVTLVTGGVLAGLAYEAVGRPWDVARRIVELNRVVNPDESKYTALMRQLREGGMRSFFRDPNFVPHTESRRIYIMLRTLGRVGPWGIGFLVWEAYGPTLTHFDE